MPAGSKIRRRGRSLVVSTQQVVVLLVLQSDIELMDCTLDRYRRCVWNTAPGL